MSYLSTAEVRAALGLPDSGYDDILDRIRLSAIDYIERYCNSSFEDREDDPENEGEKLPRAVSNERYLGDQVSGDGNYYYLELSKRPVRSIASIAVDGIGVDSAAYSVFMSDYGLIRFKASLSQTSVILVSYAYGRPDTPPEINQALIFKCGQLINQSNHPELAEGLLTSERTGDYQSNYSVSKADFTVDRVEETLAPFKPLTSGYKPDGVAVI